MTAILKQFDSWRDNPVLGQLIRFGIAGGITTALFAIVYWPVATYGHHVLALSRGAVWPLIGNVLGYLVAMGSGYLIHSNWSFKGHGSRDNVARTTSRFFVVSLISFGLNSVFVWILTGPLLHGPTWWPLIPICFVTPLVTFALNRLWVFG